MLLEISHFLTMIGATSKTKPSNKRAFYCLNDNYSLGKSSSPSYQDSNDVIFCGCVSSDVNLSR